MMIEARTRREFLRTVSMTAGAWEGCQMSQSDAFSFQQLQTNGISVRAVVEGTGPLVIMVHGFPELWYSWRHQIRPIAQAGFKVVVPDVRGYGGSDTPHPIDAYDMISLTNDVVGLIDALGEDRAILFGHDWGAPICWNTAALHPERVAAVAGLSVPFFQRGPRSSIDNWQALYGDGFFYQLFFKRKAWRRPRSKPMSVPRSGRSTTRSRVMVSTRPSTPCRPPNRSRICSRRWWIRTPFQRG